MQPVTHSSAPRILVLIPCYREAEHIATVVQGLPSADADILVVDDGSPDQTAEIARNAGATVIVHPRNQGKGAAMVTGLSYAREHDYDAVVLMDGDGQHLPQEVPRFIDAFRQTGADVIVGSRMADTKTMPFIRLLTNRFMSWLLSRKIGQRISDTQCGFRLLSRAAIPCALETESVGFAADSELLLRAHRAGLTIAETAVSTVYGTEKSHIRPVRDTLLFFNLLRRFPSRP